MTMPEPDGALGAMVVRLQDTVTEMRVDVAVIKTRSDSWPEFDRRLRLLELARARSIGAGVASGILSSGVAGVILWALQHH